MDIIDRRLNPKGKSLGNRQRFIRRARAQIREAVRENLRDRKISDSESGETIVIPSEGIHEPELKPDPESGERHRILPGNQEFQEGDRIPRPPREDGGGGREGSEEGEGEDSFAFALTREEFLDIFFEDLELPDLVKRKLKSEKSPKPQRAGYAKSGAPHRMNMVRTMRNSLVRRVALGRPSEQAITQIETELSRLQSGEIEPADGRDTETRIAELEDWLARARSRRAHVPFIDPLDLRYDRFEYKPRPVAQAVMFCLMDVSASMDEDMKDLAKRFFMLLHMFLERRYEHVEVVFIRHTHRAQEVDEESFFYGRETGGTIVSSAFKEMRRVVDERYPVDDWNIYVAQASDGDDAPGDVARCLRMLDEDILPLAQYMAYVEVGSDNRGPIGFTANQDSSLWSGYSEVANRNENFAMRRIQHPRDIFPVFRGLFSKEEAAT